MSFFHNESLRKQLYDYIKAKINSGELKPGQPINQKEIFETLQISRTPYRDCMIQLESEGIVDIIPCRGVVVKELSLNDKIESIEVAAALEGMAYELAFDRARRCCVKELTSIADRVQKGFSENLPVHQNDNMRFNALFMDCCPNRSIVETLARLRDRMYEFPEQDPAPLTRWEILYWQEHRQQIEILKHGTALELGDHIRNVHWTIKGREGYWETVLSIPKGSIQKFYLERKRRILDNSASDE